MKADKSTELLNLDGSGDPCAWFERGRRVIDSVEIYVENIICANGCGISRSAEIHPTAIIGDNVYIADGVRIGPYSYIRSHVAIMRGVVIGYLVELDRCVVMQDTKIAHQACIGRSIIGRKCNLGFGFVTATKRLDEKPVSSVYEQHTYISTRKHHGALIGEGVRAGVNVSVMPGATLMPGATISPGAIVKGVVTKYK